MANKHTLLPGGLIQVVKDGVVVFEGSAEYIVSLSAAEAKAVDAKGKPVRPSVWTAAHASQEEADKAHAAVIAKAKASEKKEAEAAVKVKE